MDYKSESERAPNIVSSGLDELDRIISGFKSGELILIGGRPAMGKSSFVLNIIQNAALGENVSTLFFTLKMSKEEVTQRFLCLQAKIDINKIKAGDISKSDWSCLMFAAGKLSTAPIFLNDDPSMLIDELSSQIRKRQQEQGVKLVIIDYLNLSQADCQLESREDELAAILSSLKALAKKLQIAILVTIRILRRKRLGQDAVDYRPQLADLCFSSTIGKIADLIILLHREEYYHLTAENKDRIEIIIAKNRTNPVGSVQVSFSKSYMRFDEAV